MRGGYIRDNGTSEAPNLGFHGIAPVEKHNIIAAFFDELVYFLRFKVNAAANNAVSINFQFIGGTECDDFIPNLHAQSWEVVRAPFGPFKFHAFKARIFLGHPSIAFTGCNVAANCAIDPMLRDEDSAGEAQ